MEAVVKYGGWVAAAIFLIFGVYSYQGWLATRELAVAVEAEAVQERDVALEHHLSDEMKLDELREEAASLRKEVRVLREQLAAATASTPEMMTDESETGILQEDSPAEPEEEKTPDRGERVATEQMAIMANIAYQDLYKELNLPEDVRDTLNDMVAAHMARVQRSTMAGFKAKDRVAKDVYAEQEAMEAELREQLESYLTPEELNAWDQYEPVADQITYERLVDGQLNMMAADLSSENRVLTSQVMAEELVREFDLYYASDERYTLDNFNNAQARALQTSLERLSPGLQPEQFELVEGYVNQALRMFEALAEQGE